MRRKPRDADYYRQQLLQGDRVALARAISAIENERADTRAVYQAIAGHANRAHVIGVTGAPGSGKSSLVNALIQEFRARGQKLGVVAVDPSSPFSGGAILGDRIRMSDHGADPGVFIRSLAARGHLGGLSRATARVVDVMDAAGMDIIIVETVGTGQSEVEVMEIAQSVVVVCAPGLGDEIQAVKAGILEIADILVVNKADLPDAERTARQLRDAAGLASSRDDKVPIVKTTAISSEGVAELMQYLDDRFAGFDEARRSDAALERMRKIVTGAASHRLSEWLQRLDTDEFDTICNSVLRGELDIDAAAFASARLALTIESEKD